MIAIQFQPRPFSLSRRAVERRVATSLAHEGLLLRKCATRSRWHSSLGDYYLVSTVTNTVHATHQELEDLAREYRAIPPGEQIAET